MDRARKAIAGLGEEDRARLGSPLAGIVAALQSEVLATIYQLHPDLEPQADEEEEPFISSELRWDQVRLPKSVSVAAIDAAIFSVMQPHWRKVAVVLVKAMQRCEQLGLRLGLAISDEALAARIQVLTFSGRIAGVGDLRKWRFSEVRLKG